MKYYKNKKIYVELNMQFHTMNCILSLQILTYTKSLRKLHEDKCQIILRLLNGK